MARLGKTGQRRWSAEIRMRLEMWLAWQTTARFFMGLCTEMKSLYWIQIQWEAIRVLVMKQWDLIYIFKSLVLWGIGMELGKSLRLLKHWVAQTKNNLMVWTTVTGRWEEMVMVRSGEIRANGFFNWCDMWRKNEGWRQKFLKLVPQFILYWSLHCRVWFCDHCRKMRDSEFSTSFLCNNRWAYFVFAVYTRLYLSHNLSLSPQPYYLISIKIWSA